MVRTDSSGVPVPRPVDGNTFDSDAVRVASTQIAFGNVYWPASGSARRNGTRRGQRDEPTRSEGGEAE